MKGECKHRKRRWLNCEEHGNECREIVCCECGGSVPYKENMMVN